MHFNHTFCYIITFLRALIHLTLITSHRRSKISNYISKRLAGGDAWLGDKIYKSSIWRLPSFVLRHNWKAITIAAYWPSTSICQRDVKKEKCESFYCCSFYKQNRRLMDKCGELLIRRSWIFLFNTICACFKVASHNFKFLKPNVHVSFIDMHTPIRHRERGFVTFYQCLCVQEKVNSGQFMHWQTHQQLGTDIDSNERERRSWHFSQEIRFWCWI
jgi:hypothetical protein